MTDLLQTYADKHFQQCLGVSFERLLEPISDDASCGQSARNCASYAALREARRQDDPSLPMGAWERELKRADWNEVNRLIVHMLQHESKDMELLAWLLEAQIRHYGIAGISATLILIRAMCLRHWDVLHPNVTDGDVEHRANIISSLSSRSLAPIKLAPLIGIEREHAYHWADWEQAHRNEQIKSGNGNSKIEGITLQELQNAINTAGTEGFMVLRNDLNISLQAIATLIDTLDPLFQEQAPSLGNMTQLLEQMLSLVEGELYKRGVRPHAIEQEIDDPELSSGAQNNVASDTRSPNHAHSTNGIHGAIRDRADAYARLAETAEFLMRLEPHSPVPYLVRRATEWGSLNTVELYQELFLRLGGQLNIFEMLGLQQEGNRAS